MAAMFIRNKVFIILIVLALIAGGVTAYILIAKPFSQSSDTDNDPGSVPAGQEYREQLTKKQAEVDSLVEAGGERSIQQAQEIIDSEVTTAEASGNDSYVVDAQIAKAMFLIDTNRAQEALDDVLLPLEQRYGDDETYKYDIYAALSWAYRSIDNQAKADEYFNKVPSRGWD